jgi:hypothetical protein
MVRVLKLLLNDPTLLLQLLDGDPLLSKGVKPLSTYFRTLLVLSVGEPCLQLSDLLSLLGVLLPQGVDDLLQLSVGPLLLQFVVL